MQHPGVQHALRLSEAVAGLYAHPEPATLFDRLSAALLSLFGAETVCFDQFNLRGEGRFLGACPQHLFTPAVLAAAAPLMPQHPLFGELFVRGNQVPLRTTDFATVGGFARTELYQHLYRPFHLSHQMVLAVPVAGRGIVTCAIFRTRRDFTEGERTLLAFVRPHIEALTRLADPLVPMEPLPLAALATHAGLTAREAEVLHRLVQGRSDKEIAHHCRISVRTVQVHLRSIYAKLGVSNRTEASLRVFGRR